MSELVVESLAFEHFALYRERQVLPMARLGLVLVQGLNLVSAAMDANGVGKTSILDALCFNWFAKRLDGKKGDAVACRFTGDQALTETRLRDARGSWAVIRGARPKRFDLVGFPDLPEDADDAEKQRVLEDRIGFGHRTFCNAVVFAQDEYSRFSTADQDEQMRMLDEIQGVDFREPLKRAKAWRDWLLAQVEARNTQEADAEAQLSTLERQRDALAKARQQFEAAKARDEELARGALREAERAHLEALRASDGLPARREAVAALRERWDGAVALREGAREAEADLEQARREERAAVGAAEQLAADLDALVSGGTCPSCREDVRSAKARERVKKRFAGDQQRLDAAAAEAAEHRRRVEKSLATVRRNLARVEAGLPRGLDEAEVRRQEREVSADAERALKQAARVALAQADARRAALAEVQARAWESSGVHRAAEAEVAALRGALAEARADRERKARFLKIAEYWVEAYGDRGLRTLLFQSVQPFLARRVSEHLRVLTAGEARMAISSHRDLKKGGARERLTFRPTWSWGGDDDGSRGQDRRMDLALFAALQDLAELQSARPFPLKAWDEPGDALDGLGRDIFVEWLAREARARGTGFFVTHSHETAASAGADAIWTVVLDREGARVEFGDSVRRPGTRSRPVQTDFGPPPATHPARRPAKAGAGRAAKTDQRRP